MRLSRSVMLSAGLALAVPCVADDAAQQAEIDLLKRQMADLQARVEQLEAGLADAQAAVAVTGETLPVPGGWREAHNWALLETGMERYRVREILGEPTDTRTIRKFVHWKYGDGLLRFYFGRLKSWEQPTGIEP